MSRPRTAPARGRRPGSRRSDSLASRLPVLREAMMRQRDFRREQLTRLDVHEPGGAPLLAPAGTVCVRDATPSVREVQDLVEAGARRALDDIELALARISTGDYGRCRVCGAEIPLAVLEAIPQTTRCLRCQRRGDGARSPAACGCRTSARSSG